jgi:hypothetical protein
VKELLLDFVRGNVSQGIKPGGPAAFYYRANRDNDSGALTINASYGKKFDGSANNLRAGNVYIEEVTFDEVVTDVNNSTDATGAEAKYKFSIKMYVGNQRS